MLWPFSCTHPPANLSLYFLFPAVLDAGKSSPPHCSSLHFTPPEDKATLDKLFQRHLSLGSTAAPCEQGSSLHPTASSLNGMQLGC